MLAGSESRQDAMRAAHDVQREWVGDPNREPQEYSGNVMGIQLPGSVYSCYIPTILLGFPVAVWGPHLSPFISRNIDMPT